MGDSWAIPSVTSLTERSVAIEFLKADEKIFKCLRVFPLLRLLFIPHALACL